MVVLTIIIVGNIYLWSGGVQLYYDGTVGRKYKRMVWECMVWVLGVLGVFSAQDTAEAKKSQAGEYNVNV